MPFDRDYARQTFSWSPNMIACATLQRANVRINVVGKQCIHSNIRISQIEFHLIAKISMHARMDWWPSD